MPKILINEKDYTNPGALDSYSNYAVLVAGFMGSGNGTKIAKDSNGVYEFHSVQDFNDTIGSVDPEYVYSDASYNLTVLHYGNLMARELLALGYPVVYLPIDPEDGVEILANEETWNIFKDKVSYDFRFITHGLLTSCDETEYNTFKARITELESAPRYVHEELESALGTVANLFEQTEPGNSDEALWNAVQAIKAHPEINDFFDPAPTTGFMRALGIEITGDVGNPTYEIVDKTLMNELDRWKWSLLETAYIVIGNEANSDYNKLVNQNTGDKYLTLKELLFGGEDAKATPGILAELSSKRAMLKKCVYAGEEEYEKTDTAGNPVPTKGILILNEQGEVQRNTTGTTDKEKAQVLAKVKVVDPLTDKAEDRQMFVDVVMLKADTGLISTANGHIANLASYVADSTNNGRGDCIALIELDDKFYTASGKVAKPEAKIIDAINQQRAINAANGGYCALTVPSVVYAGNLKMPGCFHYLACFMNTLRTGFKEWYAAAGYTRGVSSYRIDHTTVTLGEIAINALEPRNTDGTASSPKFACNVIANFRGSHYLWGNRTAYPLGDAKGTEGELKASHFLNIRQLCTTIKKQLFVACRRFTFDPNSDTLWYNFVGAIRPTLDAMKADQGIRDYKILKIVEANPKKATLKAKIRLIPIEAVEDFDIEVSLEDSFGETAVNATEAV